MPGRSREGRIPLPPAARRAAIRRRLLAFYDAGHRRLPWRAPQGRADPYRVWLSEVMLQQTRVAAAIPYFERFLARWPTLADLAAASEEEVLAAFGGLGYYARARNLVRAAREALARHGGLPRDPAELGALPGFGPYTAGAVASIAFGIPAAAVDGNAARVLARLFLVEGPAGDPAAQAAVRRLAGALVPAGRPGDFNQALMELGATVCGRAPACPRCPLAGLCSARRAGRAAEVPGRRRPPRRRRLELACALVERRGALLLLRRAGNGLFGGLWQLPAAEVPRGWAPRAALARGLGRVLGAGARVGPEVARLERQLTHRRLVLGAFRCRLRGEPRPGEGCETRWVPRRDLGGVGMPAAVRRLLEAARAESPEKPLTSEGATV